jgi:hypothetical protein
VPYAERGAPRLVHWPSALGRARGSGSGGVVGRGDGRGAGDSRGAGGSEDAGGSGEARAAAGSELPG